MLIDAHAHLDQYDDQDIATVLDDLEQRQMLTVSVATDPPSYWRAVALAARSDLIVPTFGIHPWNAPAYAYDLDALRPLITQSPMLGEIGLDFHWVEDAAHYPAQRMVFRFFLEAARAQGKIVNVHTKGAEAEVLHLLEAYAIERAIIHWYSGPLDVLAALAARGAYFTIGVEVSRSPRIRAIASALPIDRLLTETDNPGGLTWLTGQTGMPCHLDQVIATLADLKATTPAEMIQTVRANFLQLIAGDPWLARTYARLTATPARSRAT